AFLPWSLPLLAALARGAIAFLRGAGRRREDAAVFLWCWFLVPFAFYSIIPPKLPGSLLPFFPAAALLVAREWILHQDSRPASSSWGFRWACALGAMALPGVALAVPFLLDHRYGIPAARFWVFAAVALPLASA